MTGHNQIINSAEKVSGVMGKGQLVFSLGRGQIAGETKAYARTRRVDQY
jgi:hypothetical protein